MKIIVCGALRDLVPFVQFKKREKHPWRSVTFSTRSNTPPCVFLRVLNFANVTNPIDAQRRIDDEATSCVYWERYHIVQSVSNAIGSPRDSDLDKKRVRLSKPYHLSSKYKVIVLNT